jgi:methionyl-tRNA formyltransferase
MDVDSIYNLIRGLSPYPGAFTEWEGKILKIFKVTKVPDVHRQRPGSWQTDGKTFFRFAALNGWIVINNMQLEGKKRMPVEDFLRGHRFNG